MERVTEDGEGDGDSRGLRRQALHCFPLERLS